MISIVFYDMLTEVKERKDWTKEWPYLSIANPTSYWENHTVFRSGEMNFGLIQHKQVRGPLHQFAHSYPLPICSHSSQYLMTLAENVILTLQ